MSARSSLVCLFEHTNIRRSRRRRFVVEQVDTGAWRLELHCAPRSSGLAKVLRLLGLVALARHRAQGCDEDHPPKLRRADRGDQFGELFLACEKSDIDYASRTERLLEYCHARI